MAETKEMIQGKQRIQELRTILNKGKDQLAMVMAKEMEPDRLIRIAINAASRNPNLAACTVPSIGLALMNAAQFGLEPNGRDAHLVPFFNNKIGAYECTYMPDYKGLIKLAYRSGLVLTVDAKAVRENDQFEFEHGSKSFISHKPAIKDRGELCAAWALVKLKGGAETFVVLDRDAILKRKAASQSGRKDHGPWSDWEEEMWMKTAVKALSKLVPLGDEFERASDVDDNSEIGVPSPLLPMDHQTLMPPVPEPVARVASEPETGAAPIETTAEQQHEAPPQSKSDAVAAQVRGRTQKAKATATQKPAEPVKQQELPVETAQQELPQENWYEPMAGEPNDGWLGRMCGHLSAQPDIPALEEAEMEIQRAGAEILDSAGLSALERAVNERRSQLSAEASQAGAAQADGPPTKATSDATFKRLYAEMKAATNLEELDKAIALVDSKAQSQMLASDMEILGKAVDRFRKALRPDNF